jgi:hypothetical protein
VTISAAFDGITGSTGLTVTGAQLPILSPVAVKDNSQAGYYESGPWTVESGGYLGTVSVAQPNTPASAQWMLTVPAGTYVIWTSWVNAASNATNTDYSIYDGFSKLGTAQENQQPAPADAQYGGVLWAKLGTYTVTNGRITVAMSASGANGNIVANGILLTTSSSPGVIAVPSTSASGVTSSSTSGPMGPNLLSTGSGQNRVVGTPLAVTPGTSPVKVSLPALTKAPAISIAVNYGGDSPTGRVAGSSDHGIRKVKSKHVPKAHGLLIARLAREQVISTKLSVRHHTGG